MTPSTSLPAVQIAPVTKPLAPLALGCYTFGKDQWTGKEDVNLLAAMSTALACGITHFDTGADYGNGYSERLVGQFIASRREEIFLATKAASNEMSATAMLTLVHQSLERLQTDTIDLFYIHWPRTGKDMRPLMEGLENARQRGIIKAIGVSNFSVEQMAQIQEVGTINAHQLGYNLFWRVAEREVIPYCQQHNIAVITYSSLAHGILSGKFPRDLHFDSADDRSKILLFRADLWRHIYESVQHMEGVARHIQRPLAQLALRWVLAQPGIKTALVGARDAAQARQNAAALTGDIPAEIFQRLTDISNQVIQHIPDTGNVYLYYP